MKPPRDKHFLTEYDSAKRMWDVLQLHYAVLTTDQLLAKPYIAVSMANGSSDNSVYDTRNDAIRHTMRAAFDANQYLYMPVPLDRPPVEACDTLLWCARRAYENGYRPVTAHMGAQLILPTRAEQIGRRPIIADTKDRPRW